MANGRAAAGPLPPGQRAIDGFPRFGTHLSRPAPAVPAEPSIEVAGSLVEHAVALPLGELAALPRRELLADFHCVAGWSALGLRWEGVPFATFYGEVVEPALAPGAAPTHVVFRGLDGYESFMLLEDALRDEVMIADRLDGEPLDSDHGAPARLVAPSHYGYVNAKHLCRVEPRVGAPRARYGKASPLAQVGLRIPLFAPHPRARVWEEERNPVLPAAVIRPLYRSLIAPIRALCERGRGRGRA